MPQGVFKGDTSTGDFHDIVNLLVQAHMTEVDDLKGQLARAQHSLQEARIAPPTLSTIGFPAGQCSAMVAPLEEGTTDIPGFVASVSNPIGSEAGSKPTGAQRKQSADGAWDTVVPPARKSSDAGEASQSSRETALSRTRSMLAARLPGPMKMLGFNSELLEDCVSRVTKLMDETHENRRKRRWAYKIVQTRYFEAASYFFIISNSLFIGVIASVTVNCEIHATNSRDCLPGWLKIIEVAFTVWFSLELLMKVLAEDVKAFLDRDNRLWNLLDLFLVSTAWAQILMVGNTPTISLTRNMRLFRITRVIRILRVLRVCQSLRVMIFAILNSLDALVWVFAVLFFFKYIAALIFMFATADAFQAEAGNVGSKVALDELRKSFGSLPNAMMTLFMCITGGRDWINPYEALLKPGILFGALFVLFIYFMVFLVLNVIIGQVVDVTSGVSMRDRERVVNEELSKAKEFSANIKEFFETADTDSSGRLSWDEFSKYLADDNVKAYFQSLDLDTRRAHILFNLLDSDDSDEVSISEFLDGCIRLKGSARSLDLNLAILQLEQLLTRTSFLKRQLGERVEGRLSTSSRGSS